MSRDSTHDFTPNCRKCDRAYFMYGVGLDCERLNANIKCRFKKKDSKPKRDFSKNI